MIGANATNACIADTQHTHTHTQRNCQYITCRYWKAASRQRSIPIRISIFVCYARATSHGHAFDDDNDYISPNIYFDRESVRLLCQRKHIYQAKTRAKNGCDTHSEHATGKLYFLPYFNIVQQHRQHIAHLFYSLWSEDNCRLADGWARCSHIDAITIIHSRKKCNRLTIIKIEHN